MMLVMVRMMMAEDGRRPGADGWILGTTGGLLHVAALRISFVQIRIDQLRIDWFNLCGAGAKQYTVLNYCRREHTHAHNSP